MYDIIILGAGPAGYVAAIRAGQLGLKALVIEKANLGGICLNWGCIPTKALLKAGQVYRSISKAAEFGIDVKGVDVDFDAMIKRSRGVVDKLTNGISGLLKKNNVDVIMADASIDTNRSVTVKYPDGKSSKIEAKNIIIATGARPRAALDFGVPSEYIWDYKMAMSPKKQPKSLLVLGSGAIGVEFANFYNAIGTKVTVVEMRERILLTEDEEIAKLAHKTFVADGIAIHTSASIQSVKLVKDVLNIVIKSGDGASIEIKADAIVSAIGIVPNVEGIGLDKLNIALENGFIKTDGTCRTNIDGIYAIGDVAAHPCLAHKASEEAVICIEHIAGLKPHQIDRSRIPSCIYSYPQIASVGLSEAAAKQKVGDIKVGRFSLTASGKAIAIGESGMIKVIFCKQTEELLGVHMIGPDVTEMIGGMCLAMQLETTYEDIIRTIFPHPTISEAIKEAVLDCTNNAIHC